MALIVALAGCTTGPSAAPTTTSTTAPATASTPGDDDLAERPAAVATAYFQARGSFDWDRAAAVATGPAARLVEHLRLAHQVVGGSAPLAEVPAVEADLGPPAPAPGGTAEVEGTVSVRWADGGQDTFSGFRFAEAGGDLLLADYANRAGPLGDHLVDGSVVEAGAAGPVRVELVAAVWLAPDPVVAVTLRLVNGGAAPATLAGGGVAFAPAAGGQPLAAEYREAVPAGPGGTGAVLAEFRGDRLPVDGGTLRVAVAGEDGRPLGTAEVALPPFPGA